MARTSVIITFLVIAITIFGLFMVGNASVVDASRDFGSQWYYLRLQSVWASVGLLGFFIVSNIKYQKLEKYSHYLFWGTIFLLIIVLIPGISSKILGARRWLNFGGITLQPAELAKLTVSLYLASLLKKTKNNVWSFLIILGGLSGLIMLEPDLGTMIVISGMSVITFIGSGGKILHVLSFLPIVILVGLLLIFISPYRRERLNSYLDHSQDPLGSSYHIRQALLAVGSGGVWGAGIGQSKQKYEFLPEVTTDSIFAVIAEETGLIGSTVLILAFAMLVFLGLKVSQNAPDVFGTNLALGITSWIGLQALINIAAMVALVPLTGIPLPLISYGGSSLVIALLGLGILVSISRQS